MKYVDILTTAADTKDNIVTFASGDEANPTAWKDVATLASKEKHSSLLNKISTMFNNIRYLYKILGTTDISALGTVTQAISTIKSNIGDMKGISSSTAITTQGQYALDAREKNASVDGTLANQISNLNSNLSNVSARITSCLGGKWVDCPTGISMYHYESSDTTDCNIPTPCVEILTIRYATHRGIAFAVDWRKDQPHQLWVNVLHDTWIGWIEK